MKTLKPRSEFFRDSRPKVLKVMPIPGRRLKSLLQGKPQEDGFITLVVGLILILIVALVFAYIRVLHANR